MLIFDQRERLLVQKEIQRAHVASLWPPLDEPRLIQELVVRYLAYEGYVEAARAFADDVSVEAGALAISNVTSARQVEDLLEESQVVNRQSVFFSIHVESN